MKLLLTMLPTVVLVVYGQLIIKWRVEHLAGLLPESGDGWSRLWNYMTDPFVISAYLAALGGSVAWVLVVERYDLSMAFPIYVGLTIALVALGGSLLFGEALSWQRVISISLILAGVVIGSRT
jgi:multidrug transporter EmrE-like cation transporter